MQPDLAIDVPVHWRGVGPDGLKLALQTQFYEPTIRKGILKNVLINVHTDTQFTQACHLLQIGLLSTTKPHASKSFTSIAHIDKDKCWHISILHDRNSQLRPPLHFSPLGKEFNCPAPASVGTQEVMKYLSVGTQHYILELSKWFIS